ncbi:hypothetical protein CRUP_028856 [Coryphaenoides rupestris]|nr:hypothetical protein CRUP_028856 [Coryphaenoides rupestris]
MAADMPSETELLTTAKDLRTAACSSCWLLPCARKTPALLPSTGKRGMAKAQYSVTHRRLAGVAGRVERVDGLGSAASNTIHTHWPSVDLLRTARRRSTADPLRVMWSAVAYSEGSYPDRAQ